MPSTELTSDQAFQFAVEFHDLAVNLADYRMDHRDDLSKEQQQEISSFEWTFSNASDDFNFKSVVLLLDSDGVEKAVADITETTKQLNEAVKTLKNVSKLIGIATAAATLAGAIASGNPSAIAQAIGGAVTAITKKDDYDKDDA